MSELLEIVFTRTWWTYVPGDGQWFSFLYHWFNILEGFAWAVFAILVVRRYLLHRYSQLEPWYAVAFVTFAATDFREAWEQSSWLIWLKLVNLVVLFLVRRAVMARYPNAKIY